MHCPRHHCALPLQIVFFTILFLAGCFPEIDSPKPNNYIIDGPQDLYPCFSSDGNSVVYSHEAWDTSTPDYPSGLYIIDREGKNRKLVIKGNFQSPAWSPDGNWLTFSGSGSLFKCTIHGDSLTRFDGLDSLANPGAYFPSWSNDGSLIVFDKALNPGYGMYVTSRDFKNVHALFDLAIVGRDAEISNDGKFVLYSRGGFDVEHAQIFKAALASETEIQLTSNARDNRAPTLSADGSQIAWSTNLEIFVMNSDGSEQTKIGYGSDPSWAPTKELVVSHANSDYSKEVLYIMKLDGTRVQITD